MACAAIEHDEGAHRGRHMRKPSIANYYDKRKFRDRKCDMTLFGMNYCHELHIQEKNIPGAWY